MPPANTNPTPTAPQDPNPVIFSANSQQPAKRRRNIPVKKWLLTAVVALVILVLGWLGWQYFTGYGTQTLTNGGYQYQFSFSNSSKVVTLKGKNYLQGKAQRSLNTLRVIGEPTTDEYVTDCSQVGTSWSSSFSIELNGETYLVCSAHSNSVYMTVVGHKSDTSHHLLEVFSEDGSTGISQDTAKAILSSVDISQP